jgi:hypothetical protein
MNLRPVSLPSLVASGFAVLTSTALVSLLMPSAQASVFSQQEVDANRFVMVASPYNNNSAHQLMIVEQISNTRACWQERPGAPTLIDPLLANFDFTGLCGRSIDSNGYSVRLSGEDFGMKYSLRIVNRTGGLYLIGVPYTRALPELLIGRAEGYDPSFVKLSLEAGWRLTRRTYQGRAVGHVYLTNDQPLETLLAPPANNIGQPDGVPSTPSAPILVPQPAGTPAESPATQGIPIPTPDLPR